jgi:hypothetical protein
MSQIQAIRQLMEGWCEAFRVGAKLTCEVRWTPSEGILGKEESLCIPQMVYACFD